MTCFSLLEFLAANAVIEEMNNNQKELLDVKVMKIDIVATKTAIQQKVEDLEKIILKVAEKFKKNKIPGKRKRK